jgi:hydroxylamine reductase
MFCFQCEQTAGGKACTGASGVCGKTEEAAEAQDRLTGTLIALSRQAPQRQAGLDRKVIEGLFATLTNVNFSAEAIDALTEDLRQEAQGRLAPYDMGELWNAPEDLRTLKSLVLLGVRGVAAYAYHALVLGFEDEEVVDFLYTALAAIGDDAAGAGELLPLVLECGRINYRCLELLDAANTKTYGSPSPVSVTQTIEPGPFIVASGHDLRDLSLLLEQSANKGVNVYTHGELLPAHAYPELRRHPHLKGNFGTAWQNQQKEFSDVPAAFLFTTNCLMPPRESYADRVFTTAVVQHPGIAHIGADKDFSAVIDRALALGGYAEAKVLRGVNGGEGTTTGFGHDAVLSVAATVIDAIKSGTVRHIFLVGGCDGARPGRNYFTEFVRQAPPDTLILTLGCGKYRFNDLDLGEIGGLPRILDMGQCNDSYSAIKVALALAEAFGCGVNELPLTLVLSWYEQKAVSVLLSLLHLGIRNIKLGPTLPAFVSAGILGFLVENYALAPVTTPQDDLTEILGL